MQFNFTKPVTRLICKITPILTADGEKFTDKLLAKPLQTDKTHPFTILYKTMGTEHKATQFRLHLGEGLA